MIEAAAATGFDTADLPLTLLVGSLVLLVAVAAVRLANRSGLPTLLIYLAIGVALGEGGLGIGFENTNLTQVLGYCALILILIEGGLTTIEEKALGNLEKIGRTSQLIDILEPAEQPQSGNGLYFMDSSSAAAECVTLMAAGGAVIHTFPTGQGNVIRTEVNQIRPSSRATMGVRLVDLADDVELLAIDRNVEDAGEEEATAVATGQKTIEQALSDDSSASSSGSNAGEDKE